METHVSILVIFVSRLCTPKQVPTYYNTFPSNPSFSKQIIMKASGKKNSYKCSIERLNHMHRHPFLVGAVNQTGGIGHTHCSSRELVFKGSVEVDNEAMVDQCQVDEYMVKMPLTLSLSGSTHQQQQKHSAQHSTHTFAQCHI
jgi:hypothetical protein